MHNILFSQKNKEKYQYFSVKKFFYSNHLVFFALNILSDMPEQRMLAQIKLLHWEQFDKGLYSLPFSNIT